MPARCSVRFGDKTLLRGTTWYRHNLYPATYWRWWSDYLIHNIHLRVLRHIKVCAETTTPLVESGL